MEIKDIDDIIIRLEEEAKTADEKSGILAVQKMYKGEEEVVSSSVYMEAVLRLRGDKKDLNLMSGLLELDKISGGFREGNVIVVSGPTKEGKTTLCQTFTINFLKEKQKSLWFPFDTPGDELIGRFLEPIEIYLPKKNPVQKKLDWLEQKIIEGIAKFGIRIVFIDHLAMLTRTTASERNYATELQCIVMELKQIAIRWRVIIFVNHHIRKIASDSHPMLSDLKDSSGVAQDSDMVIMVWRMKEKVMGSLQHSDMAKLSVQSNRRTGKTGDVMLIHKGDHFIESVLPKEGEVKDVKDKIGRA